MYSRRIYDQNVSVGHAWELTKEGIRMFEEGNFANALSKFEAAIKLNRNDLKALQYSGICKCLLAINCDKTLANKDKRINEAISDFKIVANLMQQMEKSATDRLRSLPR